MIVHPVPRSLAKMLAEIGRKASEEIPVRTAIPTVSDVEGVCLFTVQEVYEAFESTDRRPELMNLFKGEGKHARLALIAYKYFNERVRGDESAKKKMRVQDAAEEDKASSSRGNERTPRGASDEAERETPPAKPAAPSENSGSLVSNHASSAQAETSDNEDSWAADPFESPRTQNVTGNGKPDAMLTEYFAAGSTPTFDEQPKDVDDLKGDCFQPLRLDAAKKDFDFHSCRVTTHDAYFDNSPAVHCRDKSGRLEFGLTNQGATCYLNSLIQTLVHLPMFKTGVYNMQGTDDPAEAGSKTSIPAALQQLFYALDTATAPVSTEELTTSLGWTAYDTATQQDIQEFLHILLDRLSENVKKSPVGSENFIETLFRGEIVYYTRCLDIDYKSLKTEHVYDVNLDVVNTGSIEAAFDKYVLETTLDGDNMYEVERPDGSKEMHPARRGCYFKSLPPVLVVLLKRFAFDFNRLQQVKVNDPFRFSRELDLSDYTTPPRSLSTPSEDGGNGDAAMRDDVYVLHSVMVHSGTSEGGHYVCYIQTDLEGTWLKFNDQRVTRVREAEAIDDNFGFFGRSSSAYLLTYVRRADAAAVLAPTPEPTMQAVRRRLASARALQDERARLQAERDQSVRVHLLPLAAGSTGAAAAAAAAAAPWLGALPAEPARLALGSLHPSVVLRKEQSTTELLAAAAAALGVPAARLEVWLVRGTRVAAAAIAPALPLAYAFDGGVVACPGGVDDVYCLAGELPAVDADNDRSSLGVVFVKTYTEPAAADSPAAAPGSLARCVGTAAVAGHLVCDFRTTSVVAALRSVFGPECPAGSFLSPPAVASGAAAAALQDSSFFLSEHPPRGKNKRGDSWDGMMQDLEEGGFRSLSGETCGKGGGGCEAKAVEAETPPIEGSLAGGPLGRAAVFLEGTGLWSVGDLTLTVAECVGDALDGACPVFVVQFCPREDDLRALCADSRAMLATAPCNSLDATEFEPAAAPGCWKRSNGPSVIDYYHSRAIDLVPITPADPTGNAGRKTTVRIRTVGTVSSVLQTVAAAVGVDPDYIRLNTCGLLGEACIATADYCAPVELHVPPSAPALYYQVLDAPRAELEGKIEMLVSVNECDQTAGAYHLAFDDSWVRAATIIETAQQKHIKACGENRDTLCDAPLEELFLIEDSSIGTTIVQEYGTALLSEWDTLQHFRLTHVPVLKDEYGDTVRDQQVTRVTRFIPKTTTPHGKGFLVRTCPTNTTDTVRERIIARLTPEEASAPNCGFPIYAAEGSTVRELLPGETLQEGFSKVRTTWSYAGQTIGLAVCTPQQPEH
ncbi:Ubiquitin carboxyl-terminal hydrolase 13 [Diplonema papillatum]|nr:Ubiquitin carboxyl-terminal hydrolase 13 [Diplonema papillatum]